MCQCQNLAPEVTQRRKEVWNLHKGEGSATVSPSLVTFKIILRSYNIAEWFKNQHIFDETSKIRASPALL